MPEQGGQSDRVLEEVSPESQSMDTTASQKYRFGHVTFRELGEGKGHPPDVQRAIRSLRGRLGSCPDITPDFPCYFYIVNSEDQILCSIKALPDTLWIGNEKYPWAWMGALFTEEVYRGKGLAAQVTEESRRILHKQDIGRGSTFSTEVTLRIHKKLGFAFPGYVNRYLMIKSTRPFIGAHIKSKWVIHVSDILSRRIIELVHRRYFDRRNKKVLNVRLVNLNDADPSRNSLPDLYYETKNHFNDRMEKLVWKVKGSNEKPENNCSLYLIEDAESGNPVCYFVIRLKNQLAPLAGKYKDFNLMTLMDFGLFKNDKRIYSVLLKEVVELFWKSHADVLEVISNSEPLTKLMKKQWMIKIGKGMSFTFSVPERWNFDQMNNELSSWHLTSFCGDAFSF